MGLMDGLRFDRRSVRFVRRRGDLIAIVVGVVVLLLGMWLVRDRAVSDLERDIFHAINDLPEFLYPELWPVNQIGALAIGPVVAIIAAITRRWRLAAAAVCATVLKLVLERAVKEVVSRGRPGTSIGSDIHQRGDVPSSGNSFTSGHAILVAAMAAIIAPYLPGRWKIVPWVVVGAVLFARIYVGAHNPLDVICGAGLGIAIGSALNLIFGVPARQEVSQPAER